MQRYEYSNPLRSNYTPEVLFCGGSKINDELPASSMSSQTPASNQCSRMVLDAAGIAAGWKVETMPGKRLMADGIVMPDGNVLFINGASTGVSIFSSSPGFLFSNAIRWLAMAMFPIRSVNRMVTTQVQFVYSSP